MTRTVVREALIMLEIKGLVEVRRGAGSTCSTARIITRWKALTSITVMTPGRLNCYRRVSCWKAISLNLPLCRPPAKTSLKCARRYNWKSELASSAPGGSESGDMQFHLAIAEATHNSMLVELFRQSWQWRENNPMWLQLHSHLGDTLYRKEWLVDHKQILAALIKKDARAAKLAMWQHLENVKQRLLEFSNVDDIYFDGYLFESWPLDNVDA